MARNDTTTLAVDSRSSGSSRATRRLRREGQVPGILYGKGGDPVCFAVGERDLRHALAGSGAVLELTIDGGKGEPAVLKDSQRHPVRGLQERFRPRCQLAVLGFEGVTPFVHDRSL